ncbi:hypothetical protein V491_08543, partial [Pseudogymnoascus sp. VKM F-3775]
MKNGIVKGKHVWEREEREERERQEQAREEERREQREILERLRQDEEREREKRMRDERDREAMEAQTRGGRRREKAARDAYAKEKEASWWRMVRGRFSRSRFEVPSPVPAPAPTLAASAGPSRGETVMQEIPEEANEYTPSGAASPDMISAARAEATSKKESEVRAEAAAASRIAAPRTGPKPSAAERARAAVENEPHSPSWNGSTYIDGREHHYCGSDFPCQMEPPCSP